MAEIVEILTSKGNGGQQFTVNTALPPAGQTIATHGSFECDNMEGKSLFQQGDNIAIISAGIIMPESFMFGNIGFGPAPLYALPKLRFYFYTEPAHVTYYPAMAGSVGDFYVPIENYEYVLNNYIDVTKGPFRDSVGGLHTSIPGNFTIYLSIDPATVKVSMVNVPAVLNGQIMRITPFIKILHNLPMIT